MSLDISPQIPTGRQVIQGYKGGVFRIANAEYPGAVIVLPDRTIAWTPPAFADLAITDFDAVLTAVPAVQVLLLGCGDGMKLPTMALKTAFRAAGIVVEPMDSGAACRTFNVLMGEDRRVAAALLPTT